MQRPLVAGAMLGCTLTILGCIGAAAAGGGSGFRFASAETAHDAACALVLVGFVLQVPLLARIFRLHPGPGRTP